jgi:hypothetical protein
MVRGAWYAKEAGFIEFFWQAGAAEENVVCP